MTPLTPLIPPIVKRVLANIEKADADRHAAKVKAGGKRLARLALKADIARQKSQPILFSQMVERANYLKDQAADFAVQTGCHPLAAAIILAEPKKPKTDRSEAATAARQQALVDALTSGQRCSLRRAYRLAGFPGRHMPSLDSLLAAPGILAGFRDAVLAGRKLPPKYEARILEAIGMGAEELAELKELGIVT